LATSEITPALFKQSYEEAVEDQTNLSNFKNEKESLNEQEKQEFVNERVAEWYESKIRNPMEKLRPDKIEQFFNQLQ